MLLNLIPRSKDKFVVALLNQIIRMEDILIEFQLSSMIQHFYMLRELFRARYKGSRVCRTTLLRCFRHLVQLREHLFIFTQRKIIVLRRLPKLKRDRFKALSEERANYKAAPPRQLTLDSPPLIMNLVVLRMGNGKSGVGQISVLFTCQDLSRGVANSKAPNYSLKLGGPPDY